jgi:UDP-N-acetyl-D-galactosamine dehydrogenase
VRVHDPLADPGQARHEHGLEVVHDLPDGPFDIVLAAVPHRVYREMDGTAIAALAAPDALIADLGGIWRGRELAAGLDRWVP